MVLSLGISPSNLFPTSETKYCLKLMILNEIIDGIVGWSLASEDTPFSSSAGWSSSCVGEELLHTHQKYPQRPRNVVCVCETPCAQDTPHRATLAEAKKIKQLTPALPWEAKMLQHLFPH